MYVFQRHKINEAGALSIRRAHIDRSIHANERANCQKGLVNNIKKCKVLKLEQGSSNEDGRERKKRGKRNYLLARLQGKNPKGANKRDI